MDENKELSQELEIIVKTLDKNKAEDISVLSIANISPIADYFIIANGTNDKQLQALVREVRDKLFEAGYEEKRIEGVRGSSWVLMDYDDIVIHLFSKEDRLFYDLERIWRDGQKVDISNMLIDEAN